MNQPQAGGDVYARCSKGSTAGRGSISGWTPCPLCCSLSSPSAVTTSRNSNNTHTLTNESIRTLISSIPNTTKSLKLFSHGRGLAAHLHAVHTPWKPGKAEVKRRQALQKRQQNEKRRNERLCAKEDRTEGDDHMIRCSKRQKLNHNDSIISPLQNWNPTEEEVKLWNEQVVAIVALTEEEANKKKDKLGVPSEANTSSAAMKGVDRNGKEYQSYRDSLPAFLDSAANGDLSTLKQLIENNSSRDEVDHIRSLVSLEDRNGSTAEHWAAGGGHIECIKFLWHLNERIRKAGNSVSKNGNKKVVRRRDGKTALHYAARNGRNEMIDLILSNDDAPSVNIRSGDGTSPLHLACYGGYVSTVKHLIQKHGADALAMNDWNCGAAHFAAMSLGKEGTDKVIELCKYLKHQKVDFTSRQKQGHTPLHKAAYRKNRHVIEWLAEGTRSSKHSMEALGGIDDGGNSASSIWLLTGGDKDFAQWMKEACESW